MGQITSGIRSVLSHPAIYSIFQWLMGGAETRKTLLTELIRPEVGLKILDIGCGPANILDELPGVEYWGFDISEIYIERARAKYSNRGRFYCCHLNQTNLAELPQFDVVLGMGIFHHLDDKESRELLELAYAALKPGGRFVSMDPCLEAGQNFLARFLILKDRGQNVRTQEGYKTLAATTFRDVFSVVKHTTWVPYTHCLMECRR